MSRALSTWASVPPIWSETSATMWPSPRCSRSMLAACHNRATGSSGIGSARSPAYMIRPSVGALIEALARSSAARASAGVSSKSPRMRRSAATQPRSRAAWAASGCGRVPNLGDMAGHLSVGEAVEGGVDHLGRDPAERRGASREVAVPVVAEAERLHRIVGLLSEEVDQRDRLGEVEKVAGDRLWMLHYVASSACGLTGGLSRVQRIGRPQNDNVAGSDQTDVTRVDGAKACLDSRQVTADRDRFLRSLSTAVHERNASSNHTVLPGSSPLGSLPQSCAMLCTIHIPRPPELSGPASFINGAASLESCTPTWRRPSSTSTFRSTTPAPCVTAFDISSLASRLASSITRSWMPHPSRSLVRKARAAGIEFGRSGTVTPAIPPSAGCGSTASAASWDACVGCAWESIGRAWTAGRCTKPPPTLAIAARRSWRHGGSAGGWSLNG